MYDEESKGFFRSPFAHQYSRNAFLDYFGFVQFGEKHF
jgi:hypothetical protein